MLDKDILTTLVFLPTLGAVVIALLPESARRAVRAAGLLVSAATFAVSLVIFSRFDSSASGPSTPSAWTANGCPASACLTCSESTASRSR